MSIQTHKILVIFPTGKFCPRRGQRSGSVLTARFETRDQQLQSSIADLLGGYSPGVDRAVLQAPEHDDLLPLPQCGEHVNRER